jgi:hypothetical protein
VVRNAASVLIALAFIAWSLWLVAKSLTETCLLSHLRRVGSSASDPVGAPRKDEAAAQEFGVRLGAVFHLSNRDIRQPERASNPSTLKKAVPSAVTWTSVGREEFESPHVL